LDQGCPLAQKGSVFLFVPAGGSRSRAAGGAAAWATCRLMQPSAGAGEEDGPRYCGVCVYEAEADFRQSFVQVHRSELESGGAAAVLCAGCGQGAGDISYFWCRRPADAGNAACPAWWGDARGAAAAGPVFRSVSGLRAEKARRARELCERLAEEPQHPLHRALGGGLAELAAGRLLDETRWDVSALLEATRCRAWLRESLRRAHMDGVLWVPASAPVGPLANEEAACPVCLLPLASETGAGALGAAQEPTALPCGHCLHAPCLVDYVAAQLLGMAPPPYGCPARLANGRKCGAPIPTRGHLQLEEALEQRGLRPSLERLARGLSLAERRAMPWVECTNEVCGRYLPVGARHPTTGVIRCICGTRRCGEARCALGAPHLPLPCATAARWRELLQRTEAAMADASALPGIDGLLAHLDADLAELAGPSAAAASPAALPRRWLALAERVLGLLADLAEAAQNRLQATDSAGESGALQVPPLQEHEQQPPQLEQQPPAQPPLEQQVYRPQLQPLPVQHPQPLQLQRLPQMDRGGGQRAPGRERLAAAAEDDEALLRLLEEEAGLGAPALPRLQAARARVAAARAAVGDEQLLEEEAMMMWDVYHLRMRMLGRDEAGAAGAQQAPPAPVPPRRWQLMREMFALGRALPLHRRGVGFVPDVDHQQIAEAMAAAAHRQRLAAGGGAAPVVGGGMNLRAENQQGEMVRFISTFRRLMALARHLRNGVGSARRGPAGTGGAGAVRARAPAAGATTPATPGEALEQRCGAFLRERGLAEAEASTIARRISALLHGVVPIGSEELVRTDWRAIAPLLGLSAQQVRQLSAPPAQGGAAASQPPTREEAERLSREYLAQATRPCPSCGQATSKNANHCNTAYCPCGTSFCWLCLRAVRESHWDSSGHACPRWAGQQDDFRPLPTAAAPQVTVAHLAPAAELGVAPAAVEPEMAANEEGRPESGPEVTNDDEQATSAAMAFCAERWREEERATPDGGAEVLLEVAAVLSAELDAQHHASPMAQLRQHAEEIRFCVAMLRPLLEAVPGAVSGGASGGTGSAAASAALPGAATATLVETAVQRLGQVLRRVAEFLNAQRPLLVYGALEQDGALLAGILQSWEAGRTVRQQLASLPGISSLSDDDGAVQAVLRAVERRRLFEAARAGVQQLAGDPWTAESARAKLLQAAEALVEAGMWLDGLDCAEVLPQSGPAWANRHNGSPTSSSSHAVVTLAEFRDPLQAAASSLARAAETLVQPSGVATVRWGAASIQPTMEEGREPNEAAVARRTQLPELGLRIQLAATVGPPGATPAGGAAPGAVMTSRGPLGTVPGRVGVVVAAGTLQSVHRPATLEQAWRAAAGRAVFRSPVLVEVLGTGCGWYDASQLCPVRDQGLSDVDVSEVGRLTATLHAELAQLAASCVGQTAAPVPARGALRVFQAAPEGHADGGAEVALGEKKRRLEAGTEQMDIEGDGDVDMAVPTAPVPGATPSARLTADLAVAPGRAGA